LERNARSGALRITARIEPADRSLDLGMTE
jgi:hypothetical protein